MMTELERGTIDLVVGTGPENFAQRGLHADLLMRDSIVIAARAQHPLARRRSVTLSDTLAYPWVVPAVGDFLRERIEAAFGAEGLAPPVPTVQTNSGSVIRGLLLSGDFLSFLPKRLIKGANQGGTLVAVRVSVSGWTRKVHVMSRAASVNPAGRLFVSLLRRLCSDEAASDQK
jgi:LysR family transcriptional regulator of gallate degradation